MEKRLALTKEGTLTYCTAVDENIGKGRCNHITHQTINETNEEFLKRISDENNMKTVSMNIPPEIKVLNSALVSLDRKLDEKNMDLTIKAIGGYATYDLTLNATMYIDSVESINDEIKSCILEVACENNGPLEEDWLNDQSKNSDLVGDPITKHCMNLIRSDNNLKNFNLFVEDYSNLPNMKRIKMYKAIPELVLCMKIGAINGGRIKEKDQDDLSKICKAKNWNAESIYSIFEKFGLNNFIEKSELANTLYIAKVINEKEWVSFMGGIIFEYKFIYKIINFCFKFKRMGSNT